MNPLREGEQGPDAKGMYWLAVLAAGPVWDIVRIGRQALTEVRAAVTGYRGRGLAIELETARTALADAGIAAALRVPSVRLAPETDALLGWAVREGVTNVIRHSGGVNGEVELREGDGLVLEIRDDGAAVGPAPGQGGARGNGLAVPGVAIREMRPALVGQHHEQQRHLLRIVDREHRASRRRQGTDFGKGKVMKTVTGHQIVDTLTQGTMPDDRPHDSAGIEARWKLIVDHEGVTIASDRFRLTAVGSHAEDDDLFPERTLLDAMDSGEMEAILSELHSVTRRTYGQFCGLARALEMVGERWALFIIRDLLVGPKSFADLREGLPRIPADTLAARLKELERTGVVSHRLVRGPGAEVVVYELTEYGSRIEDAVIQLSRWGAQVLDQPRPEDIVTVDSMIMALRTTFRPEAARDLRASFEVRIGEIVLNAQVDDGTVKVAAGHLPGADLVIEPGPVLTSLMSGEVSPAEAVAEGMVRLTGDAGLLDRFVEIFTIRPDAHSPA
ncbi:hypothetical protein Mth01_08020 [Sphaerimonospora thailandensis]|uniref:HTH hxlR-type domain-containing protein n=2 Tax=Sphaerimonospora thailandensis TaxID=795644 RepID=A0A8J3R5V3_9ACTN|nr:hypothetical protein Mth01_08020 [Sphaerimonospora thailandensis]